MSRVSLPSGDELTPAQRAVYDEIVNGRRGRLVGPLRAVIHSPELAARWSRFGEYLRFSACLPASLSELAILVTGRHWNSQLEFQVHSQAALSAGLDASIVEAIRLGSAPTFMDAAEADIYEYSRRLLQTGTVDAGIHDAIKARWGERGVVELTGLVGYYTMVAFTLNAHEIPMPADDPVPFPSSTPLPTLLPACGRSPLASIPA